MASRGIWSPVSSFKISRASQRKSPRTRSLRLFNPFNYFLGKIQWNVNRGPILCIPCELIFTPPWNWFMYKKYVTKKQGVTSFQSKCVTSSACPRDVIPVLKRWSWTIFEHCKMFETLLSVTRVEYSTSKILSEFLQLRFKTVMISSLQSYWNNL